MTGAGRSGAMAACGEYEGLIAASVYGQLDPAERVALDRHLVGCASCRRELDELSRAARLAGAGTKGLTPAEHDALAGRISRAVASPEIPFSASRSRRPRRRGGTARPAASRRWIAVAAAAAALLLAVFLLIRPAPLLVEREVATPTAPPPPLPPPPAPEPVPTPPPPEEKPPPAIPPPVTAAPAAERPEPPVPVPAPLLPPAPLPPPIRRSPTVPVIARLEHFEGKVLLLSGPLENPVHPAQEIASGRGVLTVGRESLAAVTLTDGTRLKIGPDSRVTEISEGGPEGGKIVHLEKGTLAAEVSPQPSGRPMTFATAEAEACVLGTRLRLATASGATRLEVEEGRVRLRRRSDGASVEVTGGHQAVAAEGLALVARPMRSRRGLQALYRFQEGRGMVVLDVAGCGRPLDLAVKPHGGADWEGAGLVLRSPAVLASVVPASRIIEACRASGELTVETWIRPAPGGRNFEGCLVGISRDAGQRNFALLQGEGRESPVVYSVWLRTSRTGAGGGPPLKTPPVPAAGIVHLAFTRHAAGLEVIYVNGAMVASGSRPGDFSGWDGSYRLVLGNEVTEERPWLGEFRVVAVYNRALPPQEVMRHFRSGVE